MGKRGPRLGAKYNTNKKVGKAKVCMNISTDLKAFIKKRAREESISESMFTEDTFRKTMLGERSFLIFQYKQALAEVEKWRHLLSLYQINSEEVVIENDPM